ncbi:unnamed protein product [Oppiella nova]|uniref:Uncharacterized protein n=1 Tax=Oppiella nova TaxID=334625 RepID=A0A7R9M782_9ACAR|nr:unnamed protein product [Oppiella nova]CAG2171949.1 unnamed protein product [Oppiella nova]
MAEQLLYVSNKYMVWEMKTICENLLYIQINTKNALKILKKMDECNNERLKTMCIEFIRENWSHILESQWINFLGNDQSLTNCLVAGLRNVPKPKVSMRYMLHVYDMSGWRRGLRGVRVDHMHCRLIWFEHIFTGLQTHPHKECNACTAKAYHEKTAQQIQYNDKGGPGTHPVYVPLVYLRFGVIRVGPSTHTHH